MDHLQLNPFPAFITHPEHVWWLEGWENLRQEVGNTHRKKIVCAEWEEQRQGWGRTGESIKWPTWMRQNTKKTEQRLLGSCACAHIHIHAHTHSLLTPSLPLHLSGLQAINSWNWALANSFIQSLVEGKMHTAFDAHPDRKIPEIVDGCQDNSSTPLPPFLCVRSKFCSP